MIWKIKLIWDELSSLNWSRSSILPYKIKMLHEQVEFQREEKSDSKERKASEDASSTSKTALSIE